VAGGTSTAGSLTRWFRDNFAQAELAAERSGGPSAYSTLADLGAVSPPGARGLVVLPYFSGERTPINDPAAKGAIFGLTLGHGRADVYRALLESVGYSIRHNIEALAAEGCEARRILAVGGGTRNEAWMQIVSDIAGIRQELPIRELGAAYGDAFLAGIGVGIFPALKDISRWVRDWRAISPRDEQRTLYEDYYRIYRGLYERNADLMHDLARLAERGTKDPAAP
jgi:xylulokinase